MDNFQSDQINELAGALAKAQGEMQHAGKTADNPYFHSKYADLPSVMDAARPALSKHGLAVTQIPVVDEQGKMILVTQLCHSSGQWMRCWYPINPVKNDPQGIGSALTYAKRYAYSAIVGVAATGEDDDGNAASGNNGAGKTIPLATPKEVKESARARNARWETIKKEILAAESQEELKQIWATNYTHIQAFGDELTDELVRHKDSRKAELTKVEAQDSALKAGMPNEFNDIK